MKKLTFIILCLEGAVLSFNVAASAALVPSIAKEFVLSQFLVGKIVWFYMLTYGVSALIYGPLVRAFDAKKVELICLFFFSCANILAALAQNIGVLFAARVLMGIFGASVFPLGLILIGEHIELKKRGEFVGLFFGASFVASLFGLLLSGILHWRLIFLLPGIAGFILMLAMYLFLPSFKQDATGFRVNYGRALKNKNVLIVFIYIFMVSLFYHGVQQWLAVYFSKSFALSQFFISMLITLTSLSGIFGEVIGGKFSDSLGRVRTLNIGIVMMVVSVSMLMLQSSFLVLALLMVIWGMGWTFNHAGLSTLLTDLPKEYLNEAASLNSSVRFISGGLGVALGGLIMQQSFVLGFTVFGVCLIGLLFFSRRLEKVYHVDPAS
ncbi:MAG: MFS transporter [Candidatus Omnitrophica bacterium]|nr:MFS transporter [Candidatus Omnitrophota bacterium]